MMITQIGPLGDSRRNATQRAAPLRSRFGTHLHCLSSVNRAFTSALDAVATRVEFREAPSSCMTVARTTVEQQGVKDDGTQETVQG